ncbi:unnamed protein product [Camellia sinensis]
MENKQKKHSMGRQKIEIKKIEKKSQLQVTFSKRRAGIFKKAGELGVLCGAHVAVIVTSPAGKVFAFGNPSVDSVIDRFLSENPNPNPNSHGFDTCHDDELHQVHQQSINPNPNSNSQCSERHRVSKNPNPNPNSQCLDMCHEEEVRQVQQLSKKYVKAVGKLEAEKERGKAVAELNSGGGGGGFWWNESVEGLELHELEQYVAALEVLKSNLLSRADEMAVAASGFPANFLASNGVVVADAFGSAECSGFGFDCKPF